jgi:hypothetical protein
MISTAENNLESYRKDLEHIEKNTNVDNEEKFSPMTLGAKTFTKKEEAAKELMEYIEAAGAVKEISAGIYRGMAMKIYYSEIANSHILELRREKNASPHRVSLGTDEIGNITRINNEIKRIAEKIGFNENRIEELKKHREEAEREIEKPFPQEEELKTKMERLAMLDIELNLDRRANTQENSTGGDNQENSENDNEKQSQGGDSVPEKGSHELASENKWAEEVKREPFATGYNVFINTKTFAGIHKIECLKTTPEYCVLKMEQDKILILDNKRLDSPMKEGAFYRFGIKTTGDVLLVKELVQGNEIPQGRSA